MKKLFAIIMATCLCFGTFNFNAFASEIDNSNKQSVILQDGECIVYQDDDIIIVRSNENADMTTRSSHYNSVWVDSNSSGSFPIATLESGTVGITLKVESSSNDSWAYISVQKPNGSYFRNDIFVTPTTGDGEGAIYKMYNASSGTYTIHYSAYTSVGMRIMCWLY